ncbi:hypothetical protein B0T17DRAFT_612620 [Bombardia bombarda]|uniref:Uncharacterized protein n=1 Tax=Bombardia bombarda TaxID=252184 RepID=A0AA39XMP6_9PEZI|nr:hypothetical protein B0T17DRAFT_612620 [Bombardia bombarda]
MATNAQGRDWKNGLCDPGDDGDCPRSCFIGCDQFGRTRYRLQQLDHHQDPLDLTNYKGCNPTCWDYCFLCFGGLYIGSGVYTGKQTQRVRETYGIKGSYSDDIVKGIFCQPCSLIRNEIEIRRRENENRDIELASLQQPPLPLGERNYRPLFSIPNNDAYKPEPQMLAANNNNNGRPQGREVHFHETPQDSGKNGRRIVPLYPTEHDRDQNIKIWKGLELPQIPHVASPESNDGLSRRSQALTPISERDSTEDPHLHQLRENKPNFPQVQDWLQSVAPTAKDKRTAQQAVIVPGPVKKQYKGKHPAPSGPPCQPKDKKEEKKASKKSPKDASQEKRQDEAPQPQPSDETSQRKPSIIIIPSDESQSGRPDATSKTADESGVPKEPASKTYRKTPAPLEHELSDDEVASSSLEGPLLHKLSMDPRVPTPDPAARQHGIEADKRVESPQPQDRSHSLSVDARVPTPDIADRQHDIDIDQEIASPHPKNRAHNISNDLLLAVESTPAKDHDLSSDISVQSHTIEEDSRVPTPVIFARREHSISRDKRVPSPSGGAFAHGIYLDERVPTPELVWLNLEHDITQDRKVLTPSPDYEEHDIHADERVKSHPMRPARQHSIRSDRRVPELSGQSSRHNLQDDARAPSPSGSRKAREHSINSDRRVTQRAYQLLEHFLEQDRKASAGRSEK